MYTIAEEDYLKAIFKIAEKEKKAVSTSSISKFMKTSPASVTDMMKKLADKELIHYQKYKGVTLSSLGSKIATQLTRKHRLWEVFLVNKLRFGWHQVHDIAEKLEHVDSEDLINRLDDFLDYPKFDPHGDPIPNAEGKFTIRTQWAVSELLIGHSGLLLGVKEHDSSFLTYLNDLNIKIGSQIKVLDKIKYDHSQRILIDNRTETVISKAVAQNLFVKKN